MKKLSIYRSAFLQCLALLLLLAIGLSSCVNYEPENEKGFEATEESGLSEKDANVRFLYSGNGNKELFTLREDKVILKATDENTARELARQPAFLSAHNVSEMWVIATIDPMKTTIEDLLQMPNVLDATYGLEYADGTVQYPTDRLYAKFDDKASAEKALGGNKLTRSYSMSESPNSFDKTNRAYNIKLTTKLSDILPLCNDLSKSGEYKVAEPIFFREMRPLNALYPNQWGLKNTGQHGGTPGRDINIEPAWEITKGSSSIKVAVIDEGVDLTHPDLQDNLLRGYDATVGAPGGANGSPYNNDSHGTACAGIIAAIDNSIGVVGVAPNCKIVPVRIAYAPYNTYWVTEDSWIANGIRHAWQSAGADVLSNSWGGGSPSATITDEINNAIIYGRNGYGCVVVFASGNENYSQVSYPANLPGVIAVGAMSPDGKRKSPNTVDREPWGSNYGNALDVVAPGVLIPTTDIQGAAGYDPQDYYLRFNGTSSACPHVAGVAALVLSQDPLLRYTDVQDLIESTCTKLPGYSYNINGWNNEVGFGLVNAGAIFSLFPPSTSYWIDTNNVRHSFGANNTPFNNFCNTSATMTINGASVSKNTIKHITFGEDYSNVTNIGNYFLSNCSALTSVDLSAFTNVTSIGTLLHGCTSLTSVDLSAFTKVTGIAGLLCGCTSLTSVDLSAFANVTSMGTLLSDCTSLTSVDLSALTKLTSIGSYFMMNCSSLTSINLPAFTEVKSIHSDFLSGCSSLTSVDLSALSNVTSIWYSFLKDCSALTSVDLSPLSNITDAGTNFMSGCSALTSVDLAPLSNVTTIGQNFMSDCTNLTTIDNMSALGNITTIPEYFLSYCTSLTSADLSAFNEADMIGHLFMLNCSSLTSVDLSGLTNVTSIGVDFMTGCTSLTSVDLSSFTNVTEIYWNFMDYCPELSSIQIGGVDWSNIRIVFNPNSIYNNSPSCTLYANSPALAAAFKAQIPGFSDWSVVVNP